MISTIEMPKHGSKRIVVASMRFGVFADVFVVGSLMDSNLNGGGHKCV